MTHGQAVIAWTVQGLFLLTLAGALFRDRVRLCRSFALYLLVVLTADCLMLAWPETFYTRAFWTVKEAVYVGLKIAIAIEVAMLALSELPHARKVALALQVIVLGVTVVAMRVPDASYAVTLGLVQPRGQAGVVWVFFVFLLVAARYRVPLHPYHRTIATGAVLYMGSQAVLWDFAGVFGRGFVDVADPLLYAASLGMWAWGAWRPAEPLPKAIARLQPWGVRA